MVETAMNAQTNTTAVEFGDIQGILRFGYKHHTEACFLLLRIKDTIAARSWLAQAPVTNAVEVQSLPQTILQVAFTSEGLRALDVNTDIIDGFSEEFVKGMSGDADRSRRLGDVGASAPQHWQWGNDSQSPHVLLLLYAQPGQLAAWRETVETQCKTGFEQLACLSVTDFHGLEPFGFADGISQPAIDWTRRRVARDQEQDAYSNLSCLGEFVLGYPNEYGLYTDRPLLDPARDGSAMLPMAEDLPHKADLGRNGSYLVLRQLRQDVTGFWKFLDQKAAGDATSRQRLAQAMVGRTLQGKPLVSMSTANASDDAANTDALNTFNYEADPQGNRCPLGAHIRRANPRNADLPSGAPDLLSKLKRILGFDADALERDFVASTRFHRILRRGRDFGVQITPEQALSSTDDIESGLHFICLNANISRQFEFVQSAWVVGTRFNGLRSEGDPLLGHREAGIDGTPTDVFSIPRADGPDERVCDLPRFINVVGGAYFFLPGIRALRYLASEQGKGDRSMDAKTRTHLTDSNKSRPVPATDTSSVLLNWISDISLKLLQFERRFDPWLRPAFDAVLRDSLARFVTYLINRQRKDEGFTIAEERPIPDEEAHLQSIIDTFTAQMTKLWKPGGFERGGNTKTHGIVRAEFIVHEGLPAEYRHGIFAEPKTYRAWVRFSGPGPYVTPDIDDVGFMSISIKLLGVPGPKLMDEEKYTQDMFGVSTPTFVTADTKSNAHLQKWSLKDASLFHFLNFRNPHLLDLIMQGLFIKTQSSPFEAPYFSCVPYLLGEGQAMMYSVWPKTKKKTLIPGLPFRPPDDYLRNAMVSALDSGDVELDFRIQRQTDPHLMPIENAAVLWPERLSPRASVATIRIPRQTFATPAQIEFEKRLSFNPWHCIPEHRPLGNQSRARHRMYWELSKLRHSKNNIPHYEPNGDEEFE